MARDTIVQFKPTNVGESRSGTRVKVADNLGSGGTTVVQKQDVVLDETSPGVLIHRSAAEPAPSRQGTARLGTTLHTVSEPKPGLPGTSQHGNTMTKVLGPASPEVLSPEFQDMLKRESIEAQIPMGSEEERSAHRSRLQAEAGVVESVKSEEAFIQISGSPELVEELLAQPVRVGEPVPVEGEQTEVQVIGGAGRVVR